MEVFNDLLNIQTDIASCRLLPVIHAQNNKLKDRFYPQGQTPKDPKKNADAVIELQNGQQWVVDFKITGSPNLQRVLAESAMQAKYAVIKLSANNIIGQHEVKGRVDAIIRTGRLQKVFVLDHNGKLIYESGKNTTAEKG